ncbi:maleylpyruvate isomerase N-terminal domain-containing protein [Allokutzneria albata]|uniref:TIGR03083 family protein n=1 Tax=Allokutzneria albata TaxID=211114 RepID=A0A1G9RMB0_ALLAB|nr:maleylpyruvate isomerase N-terminal domain-containing protein [Allokutzneria albata]SDM24396.1 TIGR03083 family protein [Allokutzneria albata]
MQPAQVMRESYEAFAAVVRNVDDERSWAPTACTGWAVRDLVYHCLGDAQRALVALHSPTDAQPDRDAVTYWSDWSQDSDEGKVGAANGRRFNRTVAGMFLHFEQLRDLHLETAAAALHAAEHTDPQQTVATQGHVLTAGDLMKTLAVEVTIHHLDLPDAPPPSGAGLAEVRATLDGLLGRPVPLPWDDAHYARAATGRAPLTPEERSILGDAFPLFS